jgi:hypothetical protein
MSFFIFSVVASVPSLVNQFLADEASSVRIITHNRASRDYPMPERYNPPVMNLPHVVAVVRESWFGGIYQDVTDQFPNLAATLIRLTLRGTIGRSPRRPSTVPSILETLASSQPGP